MTISKIQLFDENGRVIVEAIGKSAQRYRNAILAHDSVVTALRNMLETCGHLERDYPGDYDFSRERAALESATRHEKLTGE